MWFVVGLLAGISVVLLSGRGGFLIAGYNTAGKSRKKQYHEKRLCRVVGAGLGIITVLTAILAGFGKNCPDWFADFFPFITLLDIAGIIILGNTFCKVKEPAAVQETEEEKAADKKAARFSLVFCAVIFLIVGIFLVVGDIEITVEKEKIEVDGFFWSDAAIKLQDVRSVAYTDDLDVGRRTNGLGSFRLLEGNFKNGRFGSYTLYAYTKCKSYVVLETSGGIVVLNGETEQETQELYEKIEQAVQK